MLHDKLTNLQIEKHFPFFVFAHKPQKVHEIHEYSRIHKCFIKKPAKTWQKNGSIWSI